MKDASLDYATLVANADHASPHIRRRRRWVSTPVNESYYAVTPAAGINASIADMAQWLKALLGQRPEIVSPAVLQDVSQPAIKTRRELRRYYWNGHVRHAYYGLGWRILDYSGVKIIFHAGGLKGYVAQIAFVPEHNLGIVVLLNSSIENIFVSTFFDMYFAAGASALGHAAQ
jgi:beta-lactamase class C